MANGSLNPVLREGMSGRFRGTQDRSSGESSIPAAPPLLLLPWCIWADTLKTFPSFVITGGSDEYCIELYHGYKNMW